MRRDAGPRLDDDASAPRDDAGTLADAEVPPDAWTMPEVDAGAPSRFTISNEARFGPLRPSDTIIAPPSGTFDTDAQCTRDSALGDCERVLGGAGACVCRAGAFILGDLRVTGSQALVLLAWRSIEVERGLRAGAVGTTAGPGSIRGDAPSTSARGGGAGGSHGSQGGGGATPPFGSESLVPLEAGASGQDVCGAAGGGGGGALQLSAGETIIIRGVVDVSGGGGSGGRPGSSCHGGAGGGAGGAVLVEAPRVDIRGELRADGGGGGSGGTSSYAGTTGTDGASVPGLVPGAGGASVREDSCAIGRTVHSGYGGVGATRTRAASAGGGSDEEERCLPSGDTYAGGGGGGGGVGRIRVNAEDASRGCVCIGTFSPEPTFGAIVR